MPYVIDGNNVAYALGDAGLDTGRQRLVGLLLPLADSGQKVTIVFDGPRPPPGLAQQIAQEPIEVLYSQHRTADAIILEIIAANSAPRRLIVVSSDRELQQAARRRQCVVIRSSNFVDLLIEANAPVAPAKRGEPREKFAGLSHDEVLDWLKEFHIDESECDEHP